MNAWLVAAAGILGVVGLAHSYLGERYILIRLFRRADLPQLFGTDRFTRQTLRFAWHLTTVAWFGIAALLWVAAGQRGPLPLSTAGAVVSVTALASAIIALVASRGRHLAWIAFMAIAALTWLGTR